MRAADNRDLKTTHENNRDLKTAVEDNWDLKTTGMKALGQQRRRSSGPPRFLHSKVVIASTF